MPSSHDQQPATSSTNSRAARALTKKKKENTSAKIQRGWKEKDSISSVGTERRIQELLEIERAAIFQILNFY